MEFKFKLVSKTIHKTNITKYIVTFLFVSIYARIISVFYVFRTYKCPSENDKKAYIIGKRKEG